MISRRNRVHRRVLRGAMAVVLAIVLGWPIGLSAQVCATVSIGSSAQPVDQNGSGSSTSPYSLVITYPACGAILIDTPSILVTGKVTYSNNGTKTGVPGVQVTIDDVIDPVYATTAADGSFQASVSLICGCQKIEASSVGGSADTKQVWQGPPIFFLTLPTGDVEVGGCPDPTRGYCTDSVCPGAAQSIADATFGGSGATSQCVGGGGSCLTTTTADFSGSSGLPGAQVTVSGPYNTVTTLAALTASYFDSQSIPSYAWVAHGVKLAEGNNTVTFTFGTPLGPFTKSANVCVNTTAPPQVCVALTAPPDNLSITATSMNIAGQVSPASAGVTLSSPAQTLHPTLDATGAFNTPIALVAGGNSITLSAALGASQATVSRTINSVPATSTSTASTGSTTSSGSTTATTYVSICISQPTDGSTVTTTTVIAAGQSTPGAAVMLQGPGGRVTPTVTSSGDWRGVVSGYAAGSATLTASAQIGTANVTRSVSFTVSPPISTQGLFVTITQPAAGSTVSTAVVPALGRTSLGAAVLLRGPTGTTTATVDPQGSWQGVVPGYVSGAAMLQAEASLSGSRITTSVNFTVSLSGGSTGSTTGTSGTTAATPRWAGVLVDPTLARRGETVATLFNVQGSVVGNPVVTLGNKPMTQATATANGFRFLRTLDGTEGEGATTVAISLVAQSLGAPSVRMTTTTTLITDFTPPAFALEGLFPLYPTTGTSVSIAITASEPLLEPPVVTLAGLPTYSVSHSGLSYSFGRTIIATAPSSPTLLSTWAPGPGAIVEGASARGAWLAAATQSSSAGGGGGGGSAGEAMLLDVSDPRHPVRLGQGAFQGSAAGVFQGARSLLIPIRDPTTGWITSVAAYAVTSAGLSAYTTVASLQQQGFGNTWNPIRMDVLDDTVVTLDRASVSGDTRLVARSVRSIVDPVFGDEFRDAADIGYVYQDVAVAPMPNSTGVAALAMSGTGVTPFMIKPSLDLVAGPFVAISSGFATRIFSSDGLAVVADTLKGVDIYDTSDPMAIRRLGFLSVGDTPVGIFAQARRLVVALPNSLLTIAIRDGGVPRVIASTPLASTAQGITRQGQLALALGGGGLKLLALAQPDVEGPEAVVVLGRDLAGNTTNVTPGSVTVDFTSPAVSSFSVSPSYSRIGTTLSVSFLVSKTVQSEAVTVGGKAMQLTRSFVPIHPLSSGGAGSSYPVIGYSFQRVIDGSEGEGPMVPVTATVQDLGGLIGTGHTTAALDFTPPAILDLAAQPSLATTGTTVTFTFTASEVLQGTPAVTVGAQSATFVRTTGLAFTYQRLLDGSEGEGRPIVRIVGSDLAGNSSTTTGTPLLTDFTSPVVSQLAVQPVIATTGTTLTISFNVGEPLAAAPTVTVGGAPATLATSTGLAYVFSRVVDGSEGAGPVPVRVAAQDPPGNVGHAQVSVTLDYSSPILSATSVVPSLARKGTNVLVTLASNKPLQAQPTLTIGAQATTFTTQTGLTYQFSRAIDGSEGSPSPALAAVAIDMAGNRGTLVTTGLTTDFIPPTFSPVAISPALARAGSVVTVTFSASETLLATPTVLIGTRPAALVWPKGLAYTYRRTLDGSETEGTCTVEISGSDLAGNATDDTSHSLVTDFTSPSLSRVSVSPSLARAGTTVTVAFDVSEPLGPAPAVSIGGAPATILTSAPPHYVLTRTLSGSETEGTAAVEIRVQDVAGNVTDDTSRSIQTDFTPPAATGITVSPHLARKGTVVSLGFNATEALGSVPIVTVGGQPASLLAETGLVYSFQRTIDGSEGEGSVVLSIQLRDLAGNAGTDTSARLTTDLTAPTFASLAATPTPATTGTTVAISFVASEPLQTAPAVAIAGQPASFFTASGLSYVYHRLLDGTEGQGRPLVTVTGVDVAGNSGVTTGTPLVTDFTAPAILGLSVAPARATTGTTLTVSFSVSKDLAAAPTVTVGSRPVTLASHTGNVYTFTRLVDGSEGAGSRPVVVVARDAAGNVGEAQTVVDLDFTAAVLSLVSVEPSLARIGTTVAIAISSNKSLAAGATMTIGGQPCVLVSSSGLTLLFQRSIQGNEGEGSPAIVVTAQDLYGNKTIFRSSGLTTDFTSPVLTLASVAPSLARKGTTVSLTLDANEPIGPGASLTIGAQPASIVSSSPREVRFSRVIDGSEGEGHPVVVARASDLAGNPSTLTLQPLVTDFTPPAFSALSASPSPASTGTTVTLSFVASEPLSGSPLLTVGGRPASFVSSSALEYTYARRIDGSEGEGRPVVSIQGTDLAGNAGVTTGTPLVTDFTPPRATAFSASPSPASSGTTVTISLSVSKDLASIPQVTIGGFPASAASQSGHAYTFRRLISGTEPEGTDVVSALMVDLAGNRSLAQTTVILDFTSPRLTLLSVAPHLARKGTTVTLAMTSSEPLGAPPSLSVGAQPADLLGQSGLTFQFQRVIDGSEGEGHPSIVMSGRDVAGNPSLVTTSGALTTDFTPPSFTHLAAAPTPASTATTVTLKFDASEPLPLAPVVTVGGQVATLATSSALAYAYVRRIDGSEGEGQPLVRITGTDVAGNSGITTGTPLVTDFTAPRILGLSVAPARASTQTTLTIAFSASEPLRTAPTVSVGGRAATLQTSASLAYVFTRITDGTEPEGTVGVTVTAIDIAGNVGTGRSSVTLDFTAPTLAVTSILPALARKGTTVVFDVTSSEPLGSPPVLTVGGRPATLTLRADPAFTFQRTIDGTEGEGTPLLVLTGADLVNNATTLRVHGLTTDFTPPSFSSLTAAPSPATTGTTVAFSFVTSEPLSAQPVVTLSGRPVAFLSLVGSLYGYQRILDGTEGQGSPLLRIQGTDTAGNIGVTTGTPLVTDFIAPQVLGLSVSPSIAKAGTTLAIAFSASKPLASAPVVTVAGSAATQSAQAGNAYAFTYVPRGTEPQGGQPIVASLVDAAGNKGQGRTTVTLDFTSPALSFLSIQPTLARKGTTVTVNVTTSEPLSQDPTLTIGGRPSDLRNHTVAGYSFQRMIDGTEGEGRPAIVTTGVDLAGNPGTAMTTALVTDFTPPGIVGLSVSPSLAKKGTTVTVNVTVSEPLGTAPQLSLGGQPATLATSQPPAYGFRRVLDGTETEGSVTARFTLQDLAGNVATIDRPALTADFTAPTFSGIQVKPSIVSTSQAVVVTFTASEALLTTPTVTVAGLSFAALSSNPPAYAFRYVVTGAEPEGTSPVVIGGTDPAGNVGTDRSAALQFDFTPPRFAPISVKIVATTTGPAFTSAAVGATVQVTFTSSEPLIRPPGVTLGGGAMVQTTQSGLAYGFSRTIDGSEVEGRAIIRVAGTDLAGNAGVDQSASVLTDFTPPKVVAPTVRPSIATQGTLASVSFSSSEPLAMSPSVVIGSEPADLVTSRGLDYVFSRVLSGSEDSPTALVSISLTDPAGNTGRDTSLAIQTVFTPPVPVISVFPIPGEEGRDVRFSSLGTLDRSGITTTVWSFGDGQTSTAPAPVHRFPDGPATYNVNLTVGDGVGKQASTGLAMPILNVTPTILLDPISNPVRGVTTITWTTTDPGFHEDLRITLDAIDLISGVTTRIVSSTTDAGRYAWDTGVAAESSFQLLATVVDKHGAASSMASAPFVVDNKPLTIQLSPPQPLYFNAQFGEHVLLPYFISEHATVTANVIRSKDGSFVTTVLSPQFQRAGSHAALWDGRDPVSGQVVADGSYGYVVRGTDLTGAVATANSTSVGFVIVLDTVPPSQPTLDPVRSPTRNSSPTLTGHKDAGSGIAISRGSTLVTSTLADDARSWAAITPLLEGPNSLAIVAIDLAGNRSTPLTTTVVLKTIPPAAPVITSAVESPTHNATQTILGLKDSQTLILEGGVQAVPLSASTTWSATLSYLAGTNTFPFLAQDAAGNISQPTTVTIVLLPNPVAAPTLKSVVSPTGKPVQLLTGSKQANTSVVVSRGSVLASVPLDATTTWAIATPLVEGTNALTIQSFDSIHSPSPITSATIQLDTVAPIVSLLGISSMQLTSDPNIAFGISFQDPSPSSGVRFSGVVLRVDGQDRSSSALIGPATASLSKLALPLGLHAFSGTVSDQATNAATASAFIYVMRPDDGTAPVVTLVSAQQPFLTPGMNPYDPGAPRSAAFSFSVNQPATGTLQVVSPKGLMFRGIPVSLVLPGTVSTTAWDGFDASGYLVRDNVYTVKLVLTNPYGRTSTTTLGSVAVHY